MSGAVNDAENRIVGMLLGSAIADAIGIYTDQLTKKEIIDAYGPRVRIVASYKANELTIHYPDEHRGQYDDGDWSEITEMALCSLFTTVHDKSEKTLPARLRYLSRNGGITYGLRAQPLGQPIKDIVEADCYVNRAKSIALQRWTTSGNRDQDYHTGSNAPLIRIHPCAAYAAAQSNLNICLRLAENNCLYTHVDPRCIVSVVVAAALLRGLIRREVQTENQINPLIQKCKRHIESQELRSAARKNQEGRYYHLPAESWAELSRLLTIQSLPDLDLENSGGEAWKCLGAGIFCLRTAMTRLEGLSGQAREDNRKVLFDEIINSVALEGGAAQANAAFAGALLGAYLGYDAIPEQVRRGLSRRTFIMGKSKLFCEVCGVIPGDPNRVEQDSEIGVEPDERERAVMEGVLQRNKGTRHATLNKRWEDRTENYALRRMTVYDRLKFPPRPR